MIDILRVVTALATNQDNSTFLKQYNWLMNLDWFDYYHWIINLDLFENYYWLVILDLFKHYYWLINLGLFPTILDNFLN